MEKYIGDNSSDITLPTFLIITGMTSVVVGTINLLSSFVKSGTRTIFLTTKDDDDYPDLGEHDPSLFQNFNATTNPGVEK